MDPTRVTRVMDVTGKTLAEVLEAVATVEGADLTRLTLDYGACGSHQVLLVDGTEPPAPAPPPYEPELNRALREGTLPTEERF